MIDITYLWSSVLLSVISCTELMRRSYKRQEQRGGGILTLTKITPTKGIQCIF